MKILKLSLINISRDKLRSMIYIFISTVLILAILLSINISNILNEYINYSLNLNDYVSSENQMVSNLKYVTDLMLFLIVVLVFISINIIITQSIDENTYDIAIYKSCGYSNNHIFKLIFFEIFIITSVSYISAYIIYRLVLNICINIVSRIIHINLNLINIDTNVFVTSFLPLILIYIVCFIVSLLELRKIKKISIKSLINENH